MFSVFATTCHWMATGHSPPQKGNNRKIYENVSCYYDNMNSASSEVIATTAPHANPKHILVYLKSPRRRREIVLNAKSFRNRNPIIIIIFLGPNIAKINQPMVYTSAGRFVAIKGISSTCYRFYI